MKEQKIIIKIFKKINFEIGNYKEDGILIGLNIAKKIIEDELESFRLRKITNHKVTKK